MIVELLVWLGLMPSAIPSCLFPDDALTRPLLTRDLTNVTTFSLDLVVKVNSAGPARNLAYSPHSIWSSLLLAYLGAAGDTEEELRQVLRLTDKASALALYKSLDDMHEDLGYKMGIVNRLYVDTNFTVRYCAKTLLSPVLKQVDFGRAERAANTINNDMKWATRRKLKWLVKDRDVRNASVVLVNTAHFQGFWAIPLNMTHTLRKKFWINRSNFTMVDMMTTTGYFWIGSSRDLQARMLEIPLIGNKPISVLVFLPTENATVNTLLGQLTPETFNAAVGGMLFSEASVSVPELSVKNKIQRNLKQILTQMGIRNLFSTSANLTHYVPGGSVSVQDVVHKTFIEVSTAGGVNFTTPAPFAQQPAFSYHEALPFVCDRPFVFLIRDNQANSILFVGIYRKPKSELSSERRD